MTVSNSECSRPHRRVPKSGLEPLVRGTMLRSDSTCFFVGLLGRARGHVATTSDEVRATGRPKGCLSPIRQFGACQ